MKPTPEERWLPIPGWEDRYEVSDFGRVRSLGMEHLNQFGSTVRKRGIIRALTVDRRGYVHATLYRDNSQKRYSVHRLVMAAFVGACPEGMMVCHNDGNPSNNHLANLRYGTNSDNQRDRVLHGTDIRGRRNNHNQHTEDDIRTMRAMYASGRYSQREIGEIFGIRQAAVSTIVRRLTWAWLE